MTGHRLLTIGELTWPLHPVEVAIVARVTAAGNFVRWCSCRIWIVAGEHIDVHARHTEHVREVAIRG